VTVRTLAAVLALTAGARAEPAPALPPYLHPAEVADSAGIPTGAPVVRGEDVCYGRDAHRRLAYMLAAIEPMSDARTTTAWAWGYRTGRLEPLAELESERKRRIAAEADAERAQSGGVSAYIAAAAVGAAVGLVAGALMVGLL